MVFFCFLQKRFSCFARFCRFRVFVFSRFRAWRFRRFRVFAFSRFRVPPAASPRPGHRFRVHSLPITPLMYFFSHSCHSFTRSFRARINLHRFQHPANYALVFAADPPRICLFSLEKGGMHPPRIFFCFQVQCVLGSSDRCIVSDVVTRSRPLLCLHQNAPRVHFDGMVPCHEALLCSGFPILEFAWFSTKAILNEFSGRQKGYIPTKGRLHELNGRK